MRIKWYEWEEGSLAVAREQKKPILLNIGAVWCHWCHVMDRTTYAHPEVAEAVNRDFIPVRVDNDRRPDINDRYNQGGWPSTVFLTPEGDIITGATYIPPELMVDALKKVREAFDEGLPVRPRVSPSEEEKSASAQKREPDEKAFDLIIAGLRESYDPLYGGFGMAPKFPLVDVMNFVLYASRELGDAELLAMVEKTLTTMGACGVYDQVEGGFFRYSVTRDWNQPHYEKMLEDNAGLVSLLLDSFLVTGNKDLREKASHVLGYLTATLLDQQRSVFFGSQDADEEYYQLALEERASRPAPALDATVYTNWNCLMTTTLLKAWAVLGGERYRELALSGLDFLLNYCYQPGLGAYHYYDGHGRMPGLLRDQVALAGALLAAYQATGEKDYILRTQEVISLALANLWDREGGAFYDIPEAQGNQGWLSRRLKPLGDNALAGQVLVGLGSIADGNHYLDYATQALAYFADQWQKYGIFAASYAQACHLLTRGPVVVEIKGREEESDFKNLLKAAWELYVPRKVIRLEKDSSRKARAEICHQQACLAAVSDPEELKRELLEIGRGHD